MAMVTIEMKDGGVWRRVTGDEISAEIDKAMKERCGGSISAAEASDLKALLQGRPVRFLGLEFRLSD